MTNLLTQISIMDVVDVILTLIKQNPKTWAWHYTNVIRIPDNCGLLFQVKAKLNGYVMILHNPSKKLFNITFFDNYQNKLLEKKGVSIQQLVHVIHREVFKMQDSTDILMFCNSSN